MMEEKQTPEQEKREKLHQCNADIYKISDRLNAIGVDTYLAIPNLRSATTEIHKAITGLIDASETPKT